MRLDRLPWTGVSCSLYIREDFFWRMPMQFQALSETDWRIRGSFESSSWYNCGRWLSISVITRSTTNARDVSQDLTFRDISNSLTGYVRFNAIRPPTNISGMPRAGILTTSPIHEALSTFVFTLAKPRISSNALLHMWPRWPGVICRRYTTMWSRSVANIVKQISYGRSTSQVQSRATRIAT